MELMLTIASIAAVSGLTALGIVVLPWTSGEVHESLDAVRAMPEALGEASRRVSAGVGPVGTGALAR